ncbi:MAG: ATP-dependent helicase, partial [Candidatus Krumholzibacteria bacterium]|nr:ATP-dependent helicase [Candidatus Krumholzibacteria bacterium]
AYLDTITPFPEREIAEEHYTFTTPYRKFLDRVIDYCRERVLDSSIEDRRQRVRWWSALALLRALSSSPAAAAATLRNRSATADGETIEQVDEEGRRTVLDLDDVSAEGIDVVPGRNTGEGDREHERLLRLAREAEGLALMQDSKLHRAVDIIKQFLRDGYSPIIFCRFIPTVEYVASFLREQLASEEVIIEAITGLQPPEERERRVEALGANEKRVLVCTDCLSEGINLQYHFDAVMHYDLSWNPTRHEQREGRVDRYGQLRDKVRTITYYGQNNPVDGIVLQVLLRKHKIIHRQLGIIVPVPMETRIIEDAILEGLLIREQIDKEQLSFDFLEPIYKPLDLQWDEAVEREKRSRTLFAQNRMLKAVNEEVREELVSVRRAIGTQADVREFVRTALSSLGATVTGTDPAIINLQGTSKALRDALCAPERFIAAFESHSKKEEIHLTRTHPIVESLAAHIFESAIDSTIKGPGRRCGVIRTSNVDYRTTVLLLRLRCHIVTTGREGKERPILAEDLLLTGFRGSPEAPEWISSDQVEGIIKAEAAENIGPELAREHLIRVFEQFDYLKNHIDRIAEERGQVLFKAHQRVRKETKSSIRNLSVEVHKPPDVLGVFIYLPTGAGGDL